jgi:transposase
MKLNEEQVAPIKAYLAKGYRSSLIAVRFGVHVGTIRDIANGKSWSHVARSTSPEWPPEELRRRRTV